MSELWIDPESGYSSPLAQDASSFDKLIRSAMFPRRYCVDENGHRVLIGLNVEETFEFEALDATQPIADDGSIAWKSAGELPVTERELLWLELYTKHANAWRLWTFRDANRGRTHLDS